MPADADFNPLVQYSIFWPILGVVLFAIIILWLLTIFWLTRAKHNKTAADLPVLQGSGPDIAALKQKYLALIASILRRFEAREISAKQAHQELSIAVRSFVFEAKGFPAPKLTLSDLKKSMYTELSSIIESYYPDEFDTIKHGSVKKAIAAAHELVSKWA